MHIHVCSTSLHYAGVQKPLQNKDQPHSTGRLRLGSPDSWDIKIEPQGYLDSELKQPHTAERPKISSEEDWDKKIKPESSEIKQPHSTARQRLSSAASDTKSESDGGYLASESSESPESETWFKQKNSNKDRHSARPPGSTSSDSSDGEKELLNPPSISHIVASDTAALASLCTTQAQAWPMSNIQLFSENGNESLFDGDYMTSYIQPCEEQNLQAYVSTMYYYCIFNLICLAVPPFFAHIEYYCPGYNRRSTHQNEAIRGRLLCLSVEYKINTII